MPTMFGAPIPNWLTHPSMRKKPMDGPPFTSFVNAVYYPSWRIYRKQPPSSLSFDHISHVFYAFARVNDEGNVHLLDTYADTKAEVDGELGCLNALTSQKKEHPRLKIILSIGGGGKGSENFAKATSTELKRLNFARSARKLVDEFKLDGIDIDWEHPSDGEQGGNFLSLLQAIRESLPSPRYIVTAALPAGEWALQHIKMSAVSKYLDFINLMAYDFYGPWTPVSGHHSQLTTPDYPHDREVTPSGSSAVTYLLDKKVPKEKILLGIPVYGRSFLGTTRAGQVHSGHAGEEGTFEYCDLPRPGAKEHVIEKLGAAYCVGDDGGFVSYDNPETVHMKAKFAKNLSLGGLFYWTATADASGPRSLIETGFNTLHQL